MSELGGSSPPSTAPAVPDISLSYDEIASASKQPIDTGGLYEVHRAELASGRSRTQLAIKQPATDQTVSKNLINEFCEGAALWAKLNAAESVSTPGEVSPKEHIVDLVEWGDSPVPWLAMEYMDAGSLDKALAETDLPLDQALWIGQSVCRALWHAHRQGVVHHDIKPANILLRQTNDGWPFPKVGDWGIAQATLDATEQHGLTAAYAAPEQFDPDQYGRPGPATDIYQVGTLLYRLLTGELPFDGDASTIQKRKLSEDPVPPSDIANVPPAVDKALVPALERSKASRYDTVAYLRDELDALRDVYGRSSEEMSRSSTTSPSDVTGTAAISSVEDAADAAEARSPAGTQSDETDTTSISPGPDDGQESDTFGSWEAYRESLNEREQRTLYSICPGPLQRLFFSAFVSELEHAEQRRDEVASRFESLREDARKQRQLIQDEVYDSQLLGEAFTEDAVDTAMTLERLQEDLTALREEATPYLRSGEQSTIDDLRNDLAEYERYLRAKHKLTRAVERIGPKVDDVEAEIDETVTEGELLGAESEQHLIAALDEISQLIRTARQKLRTESLSESDLRRLDSLVERERMLRSRVTEHNPDLAQRRYDSLVEEVEATVGTIESTLREPRQDGEPLPPKIDRQREKLTEARSRLEGFLDSKATEYLTSTQQEQLDTLHGQLRSQEAFIDGKSEFDDTLSEVNQELDGLEGTIDSALDMEQYLTTRESEQLLEEVDRVRDAARTLSRHLDPLSDADRARYDELIDAIDSLSDRITGYNERFIEQELDRLDNDFSEVGEDGLSLNRAQKLAVIRNDAHNRVIAGPGTGKTFSLACRSKYLVDKDVPADRILALSFSRAAASEIGDRIADLFGITEVDTLTLHSMGRSIAMEANPGHVILVEQSRKREIGRLMRSLYRDHDEFRRHYEQFRELYREAHFSNDSKQQRQYFESLKFSSANTLRGETVTPDFPEERIAHRRIANTLFKQGVEYRYQQFAAWARDHTEREYTPDFTLPEYEISIEYYPPNHLRKRKDWYDRKPEIAELSQIYDDADGNREFITLHGEDHSSDSLSNILRAELNQAGVALDPIADERTLIRETYEHNKTFREIESHFVEFIKKAKSTGFESADLESIEDDTNPIVYHFSHAAAILYEAYKETYQQYNAFDYIDMIFEATDQLERGYAADQADYDHILVDEFQDLNLAQIEMVQAMLDCGSDSHLYAVGDDWQSIYGFKGARPEFFTNFEEFFSPSETTSLNINYRCPPTVVDASSALMKDRDEVVSKSLEAQSSADAMPTVHHIAGTNDYHYEQNAVRHICHLVIKSINEDDRSPDEILIVARNQAGSPFIRDISKQLNELDIPVNQPGGVRVTTAHKAKGTEAEHVIITNATAERTDGFPAVESTDSLTQLVDRSKDSEFAEERRLFYMALTRTKDRLDVQTRAGQVSQFLGDISGFVDDEYIPLNCEQDRVDVTATVSRVKTGNESWTNKQLGTVRLQDRYNLEFAIPKEDGSGTVLEEGAEYRLKNVRVDEYEGQPQFSLDTGTEIIEQ